MNRNNVFNVVLFVVLAVAILGGWWAVNEFWLKKDAKPEDKQADDKKPEPKPAREALLALAGGGVSPATDLKSWPSGFKAPPPPPRESLLGVVGGVASPANDVRAWPTAFKPVDVTAHRLIALSRKDSGYNLEVLLTNKGGGVQQVILPAFDQTGRGGKPATDTDEDTGKPYPLELVPGYVRPRDPKSVMKDGGPRRMLEEGDVTDPTGLAEPSYTITHYDNPSERPYSDLATRKWDVVSVTPGTDDTDGEVVFQTTLESRHVVIRKTFTLAKDDFHVRMKLDFSPTADRPNNTSKLVYQISGPRAMPIEGEWYAGVQRNAIIGGKSGNDARRAIVDAAHITTEHGSIDIKTGSSDLSADTFTFAAVVNQFFAGAVCIAPDQDEKVRKDMWDYVRATREGDAHEADKPQLGDITVRAISKPVDVSGKPAHAYWLYHGPTKVRLLRQLNIVAPDHLKGTERKFKPVDAAMVDDRYIRDLGLNAITDSASPGWFGGILSFIRWTDLVVLFTNLMHDVLGWLHAVVPVWGLDILILTVLVRLALMIPSRRQQASMMKMQDKMTAMKPELTKLQEKFKDDPARLNQEKTKLMIAHGVNPLSSMGGCLLMFAQMPVFLGLYYCLQESIFFRLDSFLWVKNLAAPDMLVWWSESVPFISTPDQLGKMWYLGPFVNLLPVIAVALMYINFKVSSPPPTDEQQAMQQKTMKFMMLFMGVFFYKMAAGLCIYFTVSTLWGLTERKLLKKKKKPTDGTPELIPGGGGGSGGASVKPTLTPSGPPAKPGFFDRVKKGLLEKLEEAQKQAESQGRQIINNPQQKPGQKPPPNGQPGGQGKGKKRKKK